MRPMGGYNRGVGGGGGSQTRPYETRPYKSRPYDMSGSGESRFR